MKAMKLQKIFMSGRVLPWGLPLQTYVLPLVRVALLLQEEYQRLAIFYLTRSGARYVSACLSCLLSRWKSSPRNWEITQVSSAWLAGQRTAYESVYPRPPF